MSLELDSAVGERLKFGKFELAPVARALWRRGEEVRLGSRALDILIALASRPGQILFGFRPEQTVRRFATQC
jgi:DNA-binding winged helix-turn-helix (wHTH) protein